jgi:hypothetical protein
MVRKFPSILILAICCLALFTLSSCQAQPQSSPEPSKPDISSLPSPEPCEPLPCGSGFFSIFEGVPGMENVISTDPQPHLINAATDTSVTVHYRKPIATPDTELTNAITVRDEEGNLVPGTLSIASDRAFLLFCAAEPYRPGGKYFVDYQAVEFEDGDAAKAFSIEFQVESDEKNITLGAKPCAHFPPPGTIPHTILSAREP